MAENFGRLQLPTLHEYHRNPSIQTLLNEPHKTPQRSVGKLSQFHLTLRLC